MRNRLLTLFPAKTHPVTLISDPDGLLSDESLLAELGKRSFLIVTEADPILLRQRIKQLKPWRSVKPVIFIHSATLAGIPYDLWQPAQRIQLSLHDYYPNLVYPLLSELSPAQRSSLQNPKSPLGRQATAEYILHHAFQLPAQNLDQPATLISWLDKYHSELTPLPASLLDYLTSKLSSFPLYQD